MDHYLTHAEAFCDVADLHLITLLDLGMHLRRWWGLSLCRTKRGPTTARGRVPSSSRAEPLMHPVPMPRAPELFIQRILVGHEKVITRPQPFSRRPGDRRQS